MVATTNLQLPLLAASQAQKHVTLNESLLKLDGLSQLSALSYSVAAQPASPSDGDLYLLPPGKTGADWGGAANHSVAHYFDGVWHFYTPREGWTAYVADSDCAVVYSGSAWDLLSYAAAAKPAFLAKVSGSHDNVTGDGTLADVVCDAEIFDQGANYNAGTGVFTAPVTGRYLFTAQVHLNGLTGSHGTVLLILDTSNRDVYLQYGYLGALGTPLMLSGASVIDMDAGDTAKLTAVVYGGTKVVDYGDLSFFGGTHLA